MGGMHDLSTNPPSFFLKRESFLLCNKIRRNIKIYSHLLWSAVQVIQVCVPSCIVLLFPFSFPCPCVQRLTAKTGVQITDFWARVTYSHRESLIEHSVPVYTGTQDFFLNRENNIQDKFGFYYRACSIFSAHYRPVPYTNSLS